MDKNQNSRYWQSRMVRAEEKIETLKLKVEGYEKQIRDLGRAQPVARGRAQRAGRLRDLEQRKAKTEKDLQRALNEKHQIEEEARKAGTLPGVLRGQK